MTSQVTSKDNRNGFTLIELLVVIGISIILVVASVGVYGTVQIKSQLNDETTSMVQTLRIARQRSIARVNNNAHGVYFEINPSSADRYILYQGSSYATRDSDYDRAFVIDEVMSVSTTLSGTEVNFSKSLGDPDNTGTVTLTHDVSGTKQIDINSFGKIEE